MRGGCADFGRAVTCIDKDPGKTQRLDKGDSPISEPGLDDLVARNVREGRLFFALEGAEVIANQVAEGDDALVILTEWDPLQALDLHRRKGLMATPAFVDLRNVYKPSEIVRHDFTYASIGRE